MRKLFFYFIIAASVLVAGTASAQIDIKDMNAKLPMAKDVVVGELDNGMKYYIKENRKPENRAELQIVFDTGSILEEDDQAGLAHFIEHMCFNGTKNFPKNELIQFLEATGVRFGADINAATGFDKIYYMLTIPMDKEGLLEKGMQVLEDWAHNVSFDQEELDKERGVILEEWRSRKNAQSRIMEKQFPVLLKGSKYVNRLPIGDTAVILNAPRERFLAFYNDYFRPNLTAVVAVGDFDKKQIEKMIKEKFSGWKNPKNEKPRTRFGIPDHKETLVSVATDKEAQSTGIQIYWKHPKLEEGSFKAYRNGIIDRIMGGLISLRFNELSQKKNPPFLYAGASNSNFLGDKSAFAGIVVPKKDNILGGYKSMLAELYRAYQHGFTETELERMKSMMLRNMEQALAEKDKTPSKAYAQEISRNFLEGEGMPGIEYELELYKTFLPQIKVEEINAKLKSLMADENIVIALSAPEADDVKVPSEKELLAELENAKKAKYDAWIDKVANKPLFDKELTAGTVKDRKENKVLGTKELVLSNGARVILKKTNYKNDQVLFRAYSPGGYSLAEDDFVSTENSSSLINQMGLSEFSNVELQKMLSGKVVGCSPYIGELTEGLSGSASPKDLEILFQIVNLYFTNPRLDYEAAESFVTKLRESIENSHKNPNQAISDTFNNIMSQYHERMLPTTLDDIDMLDIDVAYDFFKERFANAGDFTFIFVGNIDEKQLEDFATKYIASLPSNGEKENWKDLGVRAPKGKVISKDIKKGIEKQSVVRLAYTGDFKYTPENRLKLNIMNEIYSILLRESIREDKGGVYGIGAAARPQHFPVEEYKLYVYFTTDPERVKELIDEVKRISKSMRDEKVAADYLEKAKEIMLREYEKATKENSYWLRQIYNIDYNNEDPAYLEKYTDMIKSITLDDIQAAAKQYLNENSFIRVVRFPEN